MVWGIYWCKNEEHLEQWEDKCLKAGTIKQMLVCEIMFVSRVLSSNTFTTRNQDKLDKILKQFLNEVILGCIT